VPLNALKNATSCASSVRQRDRAARSADPGRSSCVEICLDVCKAIRAPTISTVASCTVWKYYRAVRRCVAMPSDFFRLCKLLVTRCDQPPPEKHIVVGCVHVPDAVLR